MLMALLFSVLRMQEFFIAGIDAVFPCAAPEHSGKKLASYSKFRTDLLLAFF
jgi:hypothetical protein